MVDEDTVSVAVAVDTTPTFLVIQPGQPCVWQNTLYEITAILDLARVRLKNLASGAQEVAPVVELVGPPIADARVEQTAEQIVSAALAIASAREIALRPYVQSGDRVPHEEMQRLSQQLKLKPTRLRELIRTLREDPRPKAIVCSKRGPTKGTFTLLPDIESIVKVVIRAAVNEGKPYRLDALHENLKLACDAQGKAVPHPETLASRIPRYGPELLHRMRLGPKRAKEAVRGKAGRIRTTHALAVVEIDHSPLNLTLLDSKTRQPLGRAWLTIVIDRHTRVVLGFCISLEAPSRLTVALALVHAVLPKDVWLAERGLVDFTWLMWGTPQSFCTDRGDLGFRAVCDDPIQ